MEQTKRGMHRRIYPYTTEVLQYANEREGQDPWIVKDRSSATRNERQGFGRAVVRTWVPGPWSPVTSEEPELKVAEFPGGHPDEDRIVEVIPVKREDGSIYIQLWVWDDDENSGNPIVFTDPTKVRELAGLLLEIANRMEER